MAAVLVLLGGCVMAGWLLHVPAMVRLGISLPMVFNTGLCFVLVGSVLALEARQAQGRGLRRGLCLAVITLCGLTCIELLLDHSLGIDAAVLHTWYDYGNTRPGRMAPNTALGFITIASTLLLMERVESRRRAFGVMAGTFAVLAIGLTGLVGYLMSPDLMFGWARSARMAVHTALGMVLCAAALWSVWLKSSWYRSGNFFREDEKIRILGAAILLVVTLTVGLVGFVLQQRGLEQALESSLENLVRHRRPWFGDQVKGTAREVTRVVHLSGFEEAAIRVLANGGNSTPPDAAQRVAEIGARVAREDFRGIALRDADGRLLQSFGRFAAQPELAAPLDASGSSELVWHGELLLRSHHELLLNGRRLGEIVVDEAAPELATALFNASALGPSGELAACVLQQDEIRCFPGSSHTAPFVAKRPGAGRLPLPVELAIAGNSGVIHALDYRSKNVVAAYGPLAPGLGFVAKQDTVEMYAGIRRTLAIGLPLMLALAALGALLLQAQLRPLARRLRTSEQAAREKEVEVRAIMEAAGDGIVTTDGRGQIESINPAACALFGQQAALLMQAGLPAMMPARLHYSQTRRLLRHVQRPGRRARGELQLTARRADGSEFTIELIVNQVTPAGKRLYIGVMRDISERKAAERKLTQQAQFDALTGLPNRTLFMDRLRAALLRARRGKEPLALLFLDLDGFKAINDTLGHRAGDELLVQFAQRLATTVRATDTVARLAGDEFTVVLEKLNQPAADAQAVAHKIIAAASRPFVLEGQRASISASVGLVLHYPGQMTASDAAIASEMTDLLHRADAQMYAAKQAGKNTVCVE